MAPLSPSALHLLPTASVPLGVPLGHPTDTQALRSLTGWGAVGLGLQAGLPQRCLQHLCHFPSLALQGLSNPVSMSGGLASPRPRPLEHGQRPRGQAATCQAQAQFYSSCRQKNETGATGVQLSETQPQGFTWRTHVSKEDFAGISLVQAGRGAASKDLCEGEGEH